MYETHSFFPISPKIHTNHTELRKMFYEKKIHHPQDKLIQPKKADTGIDPKGVLDSFIKKDLVKPIKTEKLFSDDLIPKMQQTDRSKWAIGTTKRPMFKEILPKKQQFDSTFYYPSTTRRTSTRHVLTDNITMKEPRLKKNEAVIGKKWNYGVHVRCKNRWEPQANKAARSNSSSVGYNILTHKKNLSINPNSIQKAAFNRKKGIAEFSDLTRNFSSNMDPNYSKVLRSDKNVFKKTNGVFTQMYHDALRNGNLVMPFKGKH